MPDAVSLSIEEANKIRLSMGLAPLPVPGAAPPSGPSFKEAGEAKSADDEEPASTVETRQAAAYDNWKKLQEEAEAKRKREERVAAIKKERERASRFAKLEGKGLADLAEEDDDLAWLKNANKRQKKIAKAERMQKELEEREAQAQAAREYSQADLAGVQVDHEIKDFDGEDHILVLKDTAVDADEDDVLESVAMKEKERLQERLELKKRKRAYDPNEENESGQTSILAQYDDEKKRKTFTLDGQGRIVEEVQEEAATGGKPKKVAISLDILTEDRPSASDYMDIPEVKIKKPKKKKSKTSRRRPLDDDEDAVFPANEEEEMQLDEPEVKPKPKKDFFDTSFVDDDDLQATLAAQRQKALKNRKKMRPEDIARKLREEASATPDIRETIEDGDEPGLVIDEVTTFVEHLDRAKTEEAEEEERRKRRKSSQFSNGVASPTVGEAETVDHDGDVDMAQSYAEAAEAEDRQSRERSASVKISVTGLDEEETVDRGLGATLKLLKQRGVLKDSNSGDLNAAYRERQKFLADKQKAEEAAERLAKRQRERERASAQWNNMSAREREEWARKNNISRDQIESRRLAEIFNAEYKPNVQLTYVDEFGREMNQKEAFKKLSHQFHGKGSGNTKTQKHLDKIAAEKKKMAESTLETTLARGMTNAQGQQSKKHKQAGVRLQ
ncbi:uncharacterized protein EI97DRAFT_198177 [Westerdykella ornata]|uniref:SART-1 protein n=1 Tax=Westerdykella ornata TaxID=318751 RepID=A0A6A6JA75_WESOR|nr:uncharacterized protein EI97DRAFT_198177 [Westerdykella ornata]KAF2272868.1 hypothetical protein EI97DRAFT_198177 [Westerdykella ornata]